MSTSASPSPLPDPAITEILTYWFEELTQKDWFMGTPAQDAHITACFGALVEKARTTSELDASWLSSPEGSLAMILLLDQFTRNIHRPGGPSANPSLSWSGDAKALEIASAAIDRGFDHAVQTIFAHKPNSGRGMFYRTFFYLPFMHAESLPAQVASCALFDLMARDAQVVYLERKLAGDPDADNDEDRRTREWFADAADFAARHRACVAALGRFPSRNSPLGRESSERERKWLEEHPIGF